MSCPSLSTIKIWAKSRFQSLPSYFSYCGQGLLKQTNNQIIVSLNYSQLENPSHGDEDRILKIFNRKFKKKNSVLPGTYSNLTVFLALFCKNKVTVSKGENGHMFSNDRPHTTAGFALCSSANNEILEQ